MKNKTKAVTVILAMIAIACAFLLVSCVEESGSRADITKTEKAANNLQSNQPTPTDLDYSLERYNLIRRAYWVNGQREKAIALPCEVSKPSSSDCSLNKNKRDGSRAVSFPMCL